MGKDRKNTFNLYNAIRRRLLYTYIREGHYVSYTGLTGIKIESISKGSIVIHIEL